MNPIELSKEQKDKLLEMCKALFPEHFTDDYNLWSIDKDYITYWKYNNVAEWSEIIIKIHWFEFCINEIPLRLYQLENDTSGISDAHEESFIKYLGEIAYYIYEKHPVDYLYEEFKKLK